MMNLRHPILASPRVTIYVLAAMVVAVAHRSAWGGDPLTMIPSDVAGVIAFRNLNATADKLTQFVKSFDPQSSGVDLRMLEEWLDFEPGTWDASKPVVFILTQPSLDILTESEFSDTTVVLAFTPKDPRQYAAPPGGRDGAVRRMEQNGRDYYVAMRDGVVFCSGKRRVMRMMRSISPSESLGATLDDQQKALCAKSDMFVHLPMTGWRERINMLALLAGNMLKLGVAAENDSALLESAKIVLDWFAGGFRSVVDQMQSLTLSADFDGDTFRLTHYHAFRADASVSQYLGQVKRSGVDIWATLPDRPFYVLAGFDWQSPPSLSVAVRFQDYILNSDSVVNRISPELRKAIHDQSTACYGQTRGSYLMLTSPPNRPHPVQILGGYFMDNAEEGGRQFRFVQENSTEAFVGFIGGSYAGKFERRNRDGLEYYELKFDPEKMGAGMRRQMGAVYGENVHIQDAVIGRNYIMYTMSDDDNFLPDILRGQAEGQNVRKNARICKLVETLPPDPHGVIVLDLGCVLRAAPYMARVSLELGDARNKPAKPPIDAAAPGAAGETFTDGPLLGWACVVRPTSFSGQLAISAKDAIETMRIARKISRELPVTTGRVRSVMPAPRSGN